MEMFALRVIVFIHTSMSHTYDTANAFRIFRKTVPVLYMWLSVKFQHVCQLVMYQCQSSLYRSLHEDLACI